MAASASAAVCVRCQRPLTPHSSLCTGWLASDLQTWSAERMLELLGAVESLGSSSSSSNNSSVASLTVAHSLDASTDALTPPPFVGVSLSPLSSSPSSSSSPTLPLPPSPAPSAALSVSAASSLRRPSRFDWEPNQSHRSTGGGGPLSSSASAVMEIAAPAADMRRSKNSMLSGTSPWPRASDEPSSSLGDAVSPLPERHLANQFFHKLVDVFDVDVPVCMDCAPVILDELEETVDELLETQQAYSAWLSSRDPNATGALAHVRVLEEELAALELNEREVKRQLAQIARAQVTLSEEASHLSVIERQLLESQTSYWLSFGQWKIAQQQMNDDLSSVQTRLSISSSRLELLRSSIVLNDVYCVWVDGHFATVNGLRLGRIPSQQVEWAEISAAVSLTAQLLSEMAKSLSYSFKSYKILFSGSSVRLEKAKDKQVLELSADPDATFIRLFANRRFDNAMSAFLTLVQELVLHIQAIDPSFRPPYDISGDKIDGKSIRMQFNSEEIWTKALKFMVTDMKWMLAWMAGRELV